MALLGPSEPPAVPPPPTIIVRRSPGRMGLVGTPLYECHAAFLGRPVYVGVVGAEPDILDEARMRLSELEHKWSTRRRRSELCRLPSVPGPARRVSADTVLLTALDGERGCRTATVVADQAWRAHQFAVAAACTDRQVGDRLVHAGGAAVVTTA